MLKLHIKNTEDDSSETTHLLMMFDAHAKCVDEDRDEDGFLSTGAVNETSHCRLASL